MTEATLKKEKHLVGGWLTFSEVQSTLFMVGSMVAGVILEQQLRPTSTGRAKRDRETERQRDRDRDTETDSETETERQTQRHRDRQRQRYRETEAEWAFLE